jgi:hypothetical protein
VLGPQHPNTATSPNNLALLLQTQGNLAEARPLYERALTICEKMLGPEPADTAQSLNNLGVLLQDQGDLAGAQPPFEPNASASSWTNRPIVPPVGPPSRIMANCGALLISTAKPSLFP